MEITKEIYDQIAPGEIFRVVKTRIQEVDELMDTILTFACMRYKEGSDWVIYVGSANAHPNDIARYGEKLTGTANILSICPCDVEVLALYRK